MRIVEAVVDSDTSILVQALPRLVLQACRNVRQRALHAVCLSIFTMSGCDRRLAQTGEVGGAVLTNATPTKISLFARRATRVRLQTSLNVLDSSTLEHIHVTSNCI